MGTENFTAHKEHKEDAPKQAREGSVDLRPKGLAGHVVQIGHNHSLQKVRAPRPTYSTDVHNNHKQRTTQKKSELEELWATNAAQELRYVHMLPYHGAIRTLYEKAQEDYDVEKAEYRELKADLIQQHKHSTAQHHKNICSIVP